MKELELSRPFAIIFVGSGDIYKFEKCVKYADGGTDDVIHSAQYYIKYKLNGAISLNLQHRPLKLGGLIILHATHLQL